MLTSSLSTLIYFIASVVASVNSSNTGNINKSIDYYEVKDNEGKPQFVLVRQGDTSFTVYSNDEENSHRLVTKNKANKKAVNEFFQRSGVTTPSQDDGDGKKFSTFLDGLDE